MVQSSCLKFCLARFSSWGLTSSKGLLSDERAVVSGFIMLLLKRSRGNSLTFIAIHLHSLEWFCRGSIIRPTKALSNCSSSISLHLQLCTWTYRYLDPETEWLVFGIFEYYEVGWSLCSNSYGPCCNDLSVLPFKERELMEDPCCQLHAPSNGRHWGFALHRYHTEWDIRSLQAASLSRCGLRSNSGHLSISGNFVFARRRDTSPLLQRTCTVFGKLRICCCYHRSPLWCRCRRISWWNFGF